MLNELLMLGNRIARLGNFHRSPHPHEIVLHVHNQQCRFGEAIDSHEFGSNARRAQPFGVRATLLELVAAEMHSDAPLL